MVQLHTKNIKWDMSALMHLLCLGQNLAMGVWNVVSQGYGHDPSHHDDNNNFPIEWPKIYHVSVPIKLRYHYQLKNILLSSNMIREAKSFVLSVEKYISYKWHIIWSRSLGSESTTWVGSLGLEYINLFRLNNFQNRLNCLWNPNNLDK